MIEFHSEDSDFVLSDENKARKWLQDVIQNEKGVLQEVNYIFCSDEYLYQMNLDFLEHDTYTDVITFPYSPPPFAHGDIFISTERTAENAMEYASSPEQETLRVMVHGLLHLLGYDDHTAAEKAGMREKENFYLTMYEKQAD